MVKGLNYDIDVDRNKMKMLQNKGHRHVYGNMILDIATHFVHATAIAYPKTNVTK